MSERIYLARHLRSLSLHIMEAGRDICRNLDPLLEPTWSGILGHLEREGQLTVTEAAQKLGISHVHAQNILKKMLKQGAVKSTPDPKDARCTNYSLTPTGFALLKPVTQLNSAVGAVIADLEEETGEDLYAALSAFQDALIRKGWSERVSEKLQANDP